jgi:hypothetical protein
MTLERRHFPIDQVPEERVRQAVLILTTEHFTVQSGRASTIADSNGRVSMFLTSTTGGMIAISFIGQSTHFGPAFSFFTLLVLPTLLLLGLATFARVAQSAVEDALYSTEINRIRHFYVEVVPEISDYFVLSVHDDMEGRMTGMPASRFQPLLSTPAIVATINSLLAGVLVGLVVAGLAPLGVGVALGIMMGLSVFTLSARYGYRTLARERAQKALFPTPGTSPEEGQRTDE